MDYLLNPSHPHGRRKALLYDGLGLYQGGSRERTIRREIGIDIHRGAAHSIKVLHLCPSPERASRLLWAAMGSAITIPLVLQPQPGGGYAVRSPELPDLITEGETEREALANAWDALLALLDAYDQLGWPRPLGLPAVPERSSVEFQPLTAA